MGLLIKNGDDAKNIRSVIRNATKDTSVGSNESINVSNTRDNNLIKDKEKIENEKNNKEMVNNLQKTSKILGKNQVGIGGKLKSDIDNKLGGINVNGEGKINNLEINNVGNEPKNYVGANAMDSVRRLGGIKVESEKERNQGRMGNEYKGIEYYTENSEKMGKAVNDLYGVVSKVLNKGNDVDVLKIREKFPEFGGIDDDVLENMISDVKNMVMDGNDNLKELVDAYPELGYVSSIDLGRNGRVEMINGLMEDDEGILDWLNEKLFINKAKNFVGKNIVGNTLNIGTNLLGDGKVGNFLQKSADVVNDASSKSIKENLNDFSEWAYDRKKTALIGNDIEKMFVGDIYEKYKDYINEKGEWLPNATDEIKEQHLKDMNKYENKATLRAVGNLFKGLPSYLELGYNMVNHLPDMLKGLGGLFVGGTLKAGEKIDEATRINGLDKWAQNKGFENWQELKEVAFENMGNKGGWLNNFLLSSDTVTDSFLNYLEDTYGGVLEGDMSTLGQSVQERGEDVLSDAMGVLDLLSGFGKVTGLLSPETSNKLREITRIVDPANMGIDIVTGGTKAILKTEGKAVEKVLGKSMKGLGKGKNALEKSFIGRGAEMVINQLTNLTKEERDFIKNNYDIVDEYLKGNRSAEDIAEMIRNKFDDVIEGRKEVGKFYDLVKNSDKLVKTADLISNVKNLLNEMGISVGEDGLRFGKLSYTPSQQKQLQQVYSYIKALGEMGDTATARDVWRARQLIDNLADWEGNSKRGLDAEVMNGIRDMRNRVDEALKQQVEGFREADLEYKERSELIKELRKDWFDKEGKLKENALSKIRNLTRGGNEAKLERLEKNFPGITQSLKGLAVSQSVEKAGKAMVGQYAKQIMTVGGIMGLISGNMSLATALIGMAIFTPKNLVKILKMQGNFEKVWSRVANKLDKGQILSGRDTERLRKWLRRDESIIRDDVEKAMKDKDWEKIDLSEREYQYGQDMGYVGKSTEKKLSKEERSSLLKRYAKGSKDNGFLMEIVDNMGDDTHGMADLDRKLIQLEQNPGDTTIQHEFFHALFSVVDDNTKKYVLNEAKKFLEVDNDIAAEEWLAESFGIYARRREIKKGNIRLKGNRLERFYSKVQDLFQRAYEWIQRFDVDKKTISKMFNEVYGALDGNVLDESGKFNLAEKLGINEKSLGGLDDGKGLRYKKAGKSNNFEYNTTNGGADRPLLGSLSTTEGGMRKATHGSGGRVNRGTQNASAKKVSSSDTANFFEHKDKRGKGYIEYNDGGGKVEKIYKKHDLFEGYSEKLNKGLKGYKDNLVKINEELAENSSKKTSEKIGKTKHGKDIMISKEGLSHIYKHGNLDFNTLINAINDPTNQKQEVMGGRYRFETRLDDGDTLVVGLQPKKRLSNGKVADVNSRVDADLYSVTSVTKGKPRGAESLEVRLKKTYHGSSADFKKFDSSHMGEGEGGQAHGWGHYVAVDRGTAKSYAEMKGADFEYKGKKLNGEINYREQSVEDRVANQIYGELKDGKKWDKAIENIKRYTEGWIRDYKRKAENAESKGMREYYMESMKEEMDGLKMLDKMKEEDFVNKGGRHLYNVEIPDPVKKDTPTGSNYLEEDGKITYQQIEKLAEGLVDYDARGNWGKNAFLSNIVNDLEDLSGGWDDKLDKYVTKGNMSGKKLYEHLVDYFGGRERGEKQASKFLESMGYDGIHYYGGIDGEAYVIFGDNNMDITNHIRYKKGTDNWKGEFKKGLERKVNNKLWEESINPKTGKKWTNDEINNAVIELRDEILGDKKKLKEVYNDYINNDELSKDVRDVFDIKGYINPDAVREIVNKRLSEKYGVSDNILASTNHPASSKIADGIRDMIYDENIEKAKKGEKIVVSAISGGGGSGKSKGPKALIENGYIKKGDKVNITLDVQGGVSDLRELIDKAGREGVLDKFEFNVAYVYANLDRASEGVGYRAANQNIRRVKDEYGLNLDRGLGKVYNMRDFLGEDELNRLYKGRTLPMSVFEGGHIKSANEKGLAGLGRMMDEMDNFNLMVIDRGNNKKIDVKKGGKYMISRDEFKKLVKDINKNKNGGLNMDKITRDMDKLLSEGKISKRQYMNLIGGMGLMILLVGGDNED